MPSLPDRSVFGNAPSGLSGRAAADYTGAVAPGRQMIETASRSGEGLRAFGAGVEKVGQAGMNYARLEAADNKRLEAEQDQIALTDAQNSTLLGFSNLDQTLAQETDPNHISKTYPDAYRTQIATAAENLNERQRVKFDQWALTHLQSKFEGVNRHVNGINLDIAKAKDFDLRTGLADRAVRTEDQEGMVKAVGDVVSSIDNSVAKGLMTREQGAELRNRVSHEIPSTWLAQKSPEYIVNTLRPVNVDDAVKLGMDYYQGKGWAPHQAAAWMSHFLYESGGKLNPNAINRGDGSDGSDSIGIGQWNSDRAKRFKEFAAANGHPWTVDKNGNPVGNDLGVQFAFAQHEFETNEKAAADAVRRMGDLEGATAAALGYERPKNWEGGLSKASGGMQRLRNARTIFGQLHEGATPHDTRLSQVIPVDVQQKLLAHADAQIAQQQKAIDDELAAKLAIQTAISDVRSGSGINAYEKEGKDKLDLAYAGLTQEKNGNSEEALTEILDKAKAVPPSVASGIRMGVMSNDPDKVAQSASMASNLMARSGGSIFDPYKEHSDIEDAATKYRHYTDYMGLDAKQAAQKIIAERDPAYKQKVKAQADTYGFGKDIRDDEQSGVLMKDLQTHFGTPAWFGFRTAPSQIAFREGDRQAVIEDYKSLIRENYDNNGNYKLSRDLAQNQLSRIWGVSKVNGEPVAMRFPPEQAPALRNIPNVSDRIGEQIVNDIKSVTGSDVDRSKIILQPIEGGVTQRAYMNNQPPPYQVYWQDKNGVMQTINKPFVPDVQALQKSVEGEFRARQTTPEMANDLSIPGMGMVN